jgi:methylenetetrahydrofolate reductase (NADPH)
MEHCCVDPDRPCVWCLIYERAEQRGRLDRLLEVQAPLDWNQVGRDTWRPVIRLAWQRGLLSPRYLADYQAWFRQVEQLFCEVRQPDWWQGDDAYHAPHSNQPVSRLQAALQRGEFVVTAEIAPPLSASGESVQRKADSLRPFITAGNITDNPMATARTSSLACSLLLLQQGVEPVLQVTARDHNRLSLQSKMLGASLLGLRNVLCLTGDSPMDGPGPPGALPFDLDGVQTVWILRRMRDEGMFLDGRSQKEPPLLFLGTTGTPSAPHLGMEARRLHKKINAGAQFVQTQLIYDLDVFEAWLEALDKRDLLSKAHVLAGIGPMRSVRAAHYLAESVPGVRVPGAILIRMEQASDPREEGVQIALELIERLKGMPGVSGVHLMAMGWESVVPRLVEEAGLMPTLRASAA